MIDQFEVTPDIVATIGRQSVARSQVLAWEARRIAKVLHMLGLRRPYGSLDVQRAAIAERKLQLGHDRIETLLRGQLRLSTVGVKTVARLSAGRRAFSTIELAVSPGSAAAFTKWWDVHVVGGDEAPLLAGCPDHWIIRRTPSGWQEVVETTGGSPVPARLFIDYEDTDSLQSKADPSFPHQITATARLRNGTPLGGLRHQLRSTTTGLHMRLTAEFPAVMLPHLMSEHRWHLACEFSNMIEYAASAENLT